MRRLELPTSTSRTWRASQLCYIPFLITDAKVLLFSIPPTLSRIFFKKNHPPDEKAKKIAFSTDFFIKTFAHSKITPTFAPVIKNDGAIAQLVEQRTENPCVPGSIPGGTTVKKQLLKRVAAFFVALNFNLCSLLLSVCLLP